MAIETVELNAGTGGALVAVDTIGGKSYQIVKIDVGADGSEALLSNSNPVPISDAGGTITVDGTVAVTNAGITTIAGAVSGTEMQVDVVTLPNVTLAASTGTQEVVGDVAHDAAAAGNPVLTGAYASAAAPTDVSADGDAVRLWALRSGALAAQPTFGGVLGVAGNGASGTGVQRVTIANDSTGVLATVSNVATIGTSVTPGTGAAHLGKAEDAAHSSGDTGVMGLAVRRDADTSLVGTDGDYAPLQVNSTGSLKVAITSGAGSGGTSIADGATFTRDTTSVTLAAAAVESSAPTLTNGDAAALSMTTGGALRVAVASGGVAGILEDAASAGGEEGIMMLAVRRDAASSGVSADGDFAALSVTSDGSLRVSGSSGTTQYTEDGASAGAESLCLMGAVRRDTAASSSGTDGDYSTINVDANGRLHVITGPSTGTIEVVGDAAHDAAAAGNPILAGAYASAAAPTDVSADADAVRLWALRSGALAVQPTFAGVLGVAGNGASGTGVQRVTIANDSTGVLATVSNVATIGTSVTPGTGATNLGKAEDAAHTTGDVGVMALSVRQNTAAATSGTDGDYQPLITDTNGRLHVITGASTGTIEVVGDVADDAATAGNPVLIAGVAVETDGTDPTTVSAEGDAAYLRTDRARRLLVSEHHPRSFFTSADYGSAQTNASVQAAPGAGLSLYITDIVISNGATAGNITLLDGSGGTVKFEIYPAINGGCTISLRQPIRLTANTALCITSTTVTTHSVNIGGYIAP